MTKTSSKCSLQLILLKKMIRLKKSRVPIFMFHCWLVNVLMPVCINVVLQVHDD